MDEDDDFDKHFAICVSHYRHVKMCVISVLAARLRFLGLVSSTVLDAATKPSGIDRARREPSVSLDLPFGSCEHVATSGHAATYVATVRALRSCLRYLARSLTCSASFSLAHRHPPLLSSRVSDRAPTAERLSQFKYFPPGRATKQQTQFSFFSITFFTISNFDFSLSSFNPFFLY